MSRPNMDLLVDGIHATNDNEKGEIVECESGHLVWRPVAWRQVCTEKERLLDKEEPKGQKKEWGQNFPHTAIPLEPMEFSSFDKYNRDRVMNAFRLPKEALGLPEENWPCTCGQTAMPDSEFCADCRTIAEDNEKTTKQESTTRPQDDLGDWVSRPCGTIGEGWRR